MPEAALLWAPLAWTPAGWRERVVLRADGDGHWAEITPGVATPPPDAQVLAGPLLPSLVNAHSHAFQRAFAGHSERRDAATDDFWSWRDRMYRVALRLSPAQLRDVCFANHLFDLLAVLFVAAVVNPIGVEEEQVSRAHEGDFCHVR